MSIQQTMTTPPVPAQRKVKLVTSLKAVQSEQVTKLQSKHQLEQDLLEDIRSYTKLRAAAEKDYAQDLLKITSQMLGKFQAKDDNKEEEIRTPYGLWRKILEGTETIANARMKISQTLQSSVAESIKTLKAGRITTVKKCSTLAETLQDEMQVSVTDLSKAQKTYTDLAKLTVQAKEHASDAQEKLRKGTVGLFSSKAKLEKTLSKANERKEVSEKRSTIARNEYLMSLAAMNAHQRKYYALDLPDLIAVRDGNIYEHFKDYYGVITSTEREACDECITNVQKLDDHILQLERAFAIQYFLKGNPVFTKCVPYEYVPVPGDTISVISKEFGAGLPLNKEARKWTLRSAREQKMIRKKTKELDGLQAMTNVDQNITGTEVVSSDSTKTTEPNIDGLVEELRHLEVLRTKEEARVEALRQAGVNVDEWLQGALSELDDDDANVDTNEKDDFEDDEFVEDEWDEPSQHSNPTNYSDDTLSTTSSQDQRCLTTAAIALYSFQATSSEEISIVDGEELEILECEGDGWCKTRNKAGQVGFVPEAYIEVKARAATMISDDGGSKTSSLADSEVYQEAPATAALTIPSAIPAASAVPSTPTENKLDYICFAKAMYDYEACEDEELSFQEGAIIMVISKMVDDDDGWWEGILNNRRGVFPSIVVEETKPLDPAEGPQDYPLTRHRTQSSEPYATFPRTKGNEERRTMKMCFDEELENT